VIEMDAWTDLNRSMVRDRIREQTESASADRLASEARRSASTRRPFFSWQLAVSPRESQAASKA
jgi:hypothetical protein